mgnify:CR=1 FL=1
MPKISLLFYALKTITSREIRRNFPEIKKQLWEDTFLLPSYFLASTNDKNIKLKETGGLDDVRWFTLDDIAGLKIYDDIRPIITRAVKILAKKR